MKYIVIHINISPTILFDFRDHLKDVIETFHLYLKLFESFLKEKDTFLTHVRCFAFVLNVFLPSLSPHCQSHLVSSKIWL